ncbi:MAG: hypothetical protein GXO86_11020 [Chlorobi bacterium]|nr:hypothetical protein [Chlorobiota bacterium]
MKKISFVIVILLFLFTNGGYYLYFRTMQYQARQEIRQKIENGVNEKDLTLITIPLNNKKDISWIKPGKELLYKGAMYDVVRIKTDGQNQYYYCINDIKEKQLVTRYMKQRKQREKTARRLKQNQSNKYIPGNYSIRANFSDSDFSFPVYHFYYKSNFTDVSSPPPKRSFFIS